MAEFKVGDTVRLKSGGPVMTVTGVGKNSDGSPKIWTAWFNGNEEKNGFYEHSAALEAATTGPVIV